MVRKYVFHFPEHLRNSLFGKSKKNKLMNKIESGIKRWNLFPFSCELVKDEILRE